LNPQFISVEPQARRLLISSPVPVPYRLVESSARRSWRWSRSLLVNASSLRALSAFYRKLTSRSRGPPLFRLICLCPLKVSLSQIWRTGALIWWRICTEDRKDRKELRELTKSYFGGYARPRHRRDAYAPVPDSTGVRTSFSDDRSRRRGSPRNCFRTAQRSVGDSLVWGWIWPQQQHTRPACILFLRAHQTLGCSRRV